MFWIGLIIALLAGVIGIGLSRDWVKKHFAKLQDLHLDRLALLLLLVGLVLSAVEYSKQTKTINYLEEEQIGRVLSPDQKTTLIEVLSSLPKNNVYLMGIQGDREAVRFANALKEVFLSADWTVDGVWEDILLGGPGPGIIVRQSSSSIDSVGQLITKAFNKIHIQARLVNRKDLAPQKLEIIVGSRP